MFISVIINLGILYWAMKKFFWKPVSEFMEKRTASIENSFAEAERKNMYADDLKKKYEDILDSSKEEANRIQNEAKARAQREYDAVITQSKADSEALLQKTRAEIEREREQMIKEVRNDVASLALAAASKVLSANMDNERNRILVEKFIDEAGAA